MRKILVDPRWNSLYAARSRWTSGKLASSENKEKEDLHENQAQGHFPCGFHFLISVVPVFAHHGNASYDGKGVTIREL